MTLMRDNKQVSKTLQKVINKKRFICCNGCLTNYDMIMPMNEDDDED